jgi:hypothetical protein
VSGDKELVDHELKNVLEELAKAGDPTRYVQKPEQIEVKDGETCWMNQVRVCGPDCIAFNRDEIDEHGSPVQGPTKCTLIVLAGQLGAGMTALVQLTQKAQQMQHTPAAPRPPKVG